MINSANPKNWLATNTPVDVLNKAWKDGYYDYLESDEFSNVFLSEIASICNNIGDPVLDIGCGTAKILELLEVPYFGIDISTAAINKAKQRRSFKCPHKQACLLNTNFLEPEYINIKNKHTIIFGGLLSVIISKKHHVDFIELWRRKAKATNFVIYDLDRVDTDILKLKYGEPKEEIYKKVTPPIQNIPVEKSSRKIIYFSLSEHWYV